MGSEDSTGSASVKGTHVHGGDTIICAQQQGSLRDAGRVPATPDAIIVLVLPSYHGCCVLLYCCVLG